MIRDISLAGKEIIVYGESKRKNGKRYTVAHLNKYLRQFKLFEALPLIGKISYQLLKNNNNKIVIHNVPIFNHVLAYIAMSLIENSTDYDKNKKLMTERELLGAVHMYYDIPDPLENDNENYEGCLIRLGSSQFDYDREARHLIPRTLIIFRDLWSNLVGSQININNTLQQICGLTLEEILIFGIVFSLRGHNGFFRPYKEDEQYPNDLTDVFTLTKQAKFLNWISCRYFKFRENLNKLNKDMPQNPTYKKFRFNPLLKTPIIIPDINPARGHPQVYITPIPRLIYERVTRGLYFDLADFFKNSNNNVSNLFRGNFGKVFQEYVGIIFKKSLGENFVKAEWKYGPKKQRKDTPDWLIIQEKRAILIEVKQSGLFLNAKKWGELQNIQNDLKHTIGSGVKQMWEFENAIKAGNDSDLECLNNIQIIERMVVTYDRPYFLNSTIREMIRNIYPDIPANYHWHSISIEELEYFIEIVRNVDGLFESLENKRLNPNKDCMDFRDYYSREYPNIECSNPYLDSMYNEFFKRLGID
jgi:hypothetical protein